MSQQRNASPTPLPSPPPDSPLAHLNDDIFDSASSPTAGPESQDWVKLRATHHTEGYRAAISISKAQFVQAGFDRGYELGGKMGLVAGWLRGVGEGLVHAVSGEEGGWKVREVKGLVRELEREVVLERLLGREWIDQDGGWKWEVGRWEEGEGDKISRHQEGDGSGNPDVDIDLVVQSHPVLRKWVARVTDMAGKLGLDIHGAGRQNDVINMEGERHEVASDVIRA